MVVLPLAGIALAVQLVAAVLGQKKSTNACSPSCRGPWWMPFNAERALHAFLANDTWADAYQKAVLGDQLTVNSRRFFTNRFLDGCGNATAMLRDVYELAVVVEAEERAAHFREMCSALSVGACSNFTRQMEEIYGDPKQTHNEQCQQVERLLCQMPAAELARLSNQRAYWYRIERGIEPPTYEAAFRYTYALYDLNETLKARALGLIKRFENEYTLSGVELEAEMRNWAAAAFQNNDAQRALAALQWHVYKFWTIPKSERMMEDFYRKKQCLLNEAVNCDETNKGLASPMCYHCKGPWTVPFSADTYLVYYLPPDEKEKYVDEVLKKSPHITWSERREATLQFLSSHRNAWLTQTYRNLSAVEAFERKMHHANLSTHFTGNPYRDKFMKILDAVNNPNITFGRMCAQIKTAYCHIPLNRLNDAFPPHVPPPYDYRIEWGRLPPTFDNLLGTYTFRSLERKAWKAADAFLDEYRYSMNDSAYVEWANALPTKESQMLAIVHLNLYRHRYSVEANNYLVYGANVVDTTGQKCFNCMGPWTETLNASSIMRAIVDEYDVEWQMRFIMEAAEVTKERRRSAIRRLIAESYGRRQHMTYNMTVLYEKVITLAQYEAGQYRLSLEKQIDVDAGKLMWDLVQVVNDQTLTDEQTCRLVEQMLCKRRPGRAELLRQPAYNAYVLAPGRPLPTFQQMWNTFALKFVTKAQEVEFAQLVSNHNLAFPVLRDRYENWADQLLAIAKEMAMLQWRVYHVRLMRLDRENRKRLSRADASRETLHAYVAIVDKFNHGNLTLSETAAAVQLISGTKPFPLYPDQC